MRTIETTIYKFSELSESAKERARNWLRSCQDAGGDWSAESLESIKAFCAAYGVKLADWSIGPWAPIEYRTNADNSTFRGLKLSSIDRDAMPTGYCLDCTLYYTFHDEFKRTGDAKGAFSAALDAAFQEWRDDCEFQLSDEAIDESIEANCYEFTEEGEIV